MEGVHRYSSVSEEKALMKEPRPIQEQRVASGPQVYLLAYDLHHHHVFPVYLHKLLLTANHLEVVPRREGANTDRA